jgi:hypothetical protein
MPHDAMRQWKSTGKTCTFSEYLDLIAPAQEEYIRKCTDGLTASAAHWAVNHQESWPYDLRDFTLGVVSSWDLDDVMDSKSYEEIPQKYGGLFDQAVERARQLGPPGGLPCTSPRNSWTSSAPIERLQALSANRGLPPVLPAGALSLSVRNDGPAQSPSRTTSMEAPEAPLASWTLSTPGMLGVVEYA